MHETTFVHFDICHRITILPKLYSVILTYFFIVKNNLNVNINQRKEKMHQTTFIHFDIFHRIASLRKLFCMNVTNFLKVKNLNFIIPETVRASANIHQTTFVHFDIFHRMTTLQKL